MIENKINNLKNNLTNIRMSADDKRDVFKRVSLVIDKIEAISSESHSVPVISPFSNNNIFGNGLFGRRLASNIFVYVRQRKFVPSLVVVLLLSITGGVSAVAEDALPGDSLYSMKVNVNEQVKGFVAVTPEAKARLAVETTERRLQEAVILSSQGKLTDERKQIIQGQLGKNATDVKNSVATLVASNNISVAQEVAINFGASLKTHELILETLAKNEDDLQNASTTNVTATSSLNASTTPDVNASTTTDTASTSVGVSTSSTVSVQPTTVTVSTQPINTLMQDIRKEINYSTQIRQDLSQIEIAEATDPAKISAKIKEVKIKYANLLYQRKTLTDLSLASIKLFDSYLSTATSSINNAETALKNNDLPKSVISLQQAIKAMSDSDSLLSIELNSKPEIRRALELIDINKLINSNKSDATSSTSVLQSGVNIGLNAPVGASAGTVLGTSTYYSPPSSSDPAGNVSVVAPLI